MKIQGYTAKSGKKLYKVCYKGKIAVDSDLYTAINILLSIR